MSLRTRLPGAFDVDFSLTAVAGAHPREKLRPRIARMKAQTVVGTTNVHPRCLRSFESATDSAKVVIFHKRQPLRRWRAAVTALRTKHPDHYRAG